MQDAEHHEFSVARVQNCLESAGFWSSHITLYAHEIRKRADNFAIASAAVAAFTGLAIWGPLQQNDEWWAVALVSLFAFVASMLSVIPQIKGYSRTAQDAAALGPRYGHVYGELQDTLEMLKQGHADAAFVEHAIKEFEEIKQAKDGLDLPAKKYQAKRDRAKAARGPAAAAPV